MWHRSCIVLVLLGVSVANATPVWIYNTGFVNADPTGVGCSSFTRGYDPYTGFFTYICYPDVMNSNHLSSPTFVKTSPSTEDIDEDSAEDGILTPQESFLVRSADPDTNSRRQNLCPPGQIFQSELNICIPYPSAPPLPPQRSSN